MTDQTRVIVECRNCGRQEIGPDDVTLELGDATEGIADTYRFTCPACGTTRRRGASQRLTSMLLAVGTPREMRITEREIGAFRTHLAALTGPEIIDLLEE